VTRHDLAMELWAGMVDVGPSRGGELIDEGRGAYAYCAGQANDLPDFLARLTAAAAVAGLELRAIDWIARHATLPERTRISLAVSDVVKTTLDTGTVAFDHFHSYPDENDPESVRLDAMKEELETFVGNWLDGAIDRYDGGFELGDSAFVAELRFGDVTEIGWAGSGADPAALLRRAAEQLPE
jgi:hypothetical protein